MLLPDGNYKNTTKTMSRDFPGLCSGYKIVSKYAMRGK